MARRPPTTTRTEVRITDPRALRALAHPARQHIVNELYSGETLTATEAAELTGLTPSAMSYHLRALAKWGIVTRDESNDGRERPWRAAADGLTITPGAHRDAGLAQSRRSIRAWFGDVESGLDRLAQRVAEGHEQGMTSQGRLWMTPAEEKLLRKQVQALTSSFKGRTRREHPDGAEPWDLYTLLLPAESPLRESGSG